MRTSSTLVYRENRARFPLEELRKCDGKWVAFTADGQRIVASGSSIAKLLCRLQAVKHGLHEVVIERIEIDSTEISTGGAYCCDY
jgi:hypothetical protein